MLPSLSGELFLNSPLVLAIALIAVCCDALLPVIPSGTLVLAASLWATAQGVDPLALAAPVAAASLLGDLLVVRLAGRRPARRSAVTAAAARLEEALAGRLGRTTVAARFVPGGRTVLALAVGATGVSQRRYLGWSAAGGLLWAGYLTGLGRLNSLWFDTAWLGFAVSVLASLVIGACLARALSVRKHPARRGPQVQIAGGPGPHGLTDADLRSLGHRTHPLEPQRAHALRPGSERTPPVRRATAHPGPRRGSHHCTEGSSPARNAIQRYGQHHARRLRRADRDADANSWRTSNSSGLRRICRRLSRPVKTVKAPGTHRPRGPGPPPGVACDI